MIRARLAFGCGGDRPFAPADPEATPIPDTPANLPVRPDPESRSLDPERHGATGRTNGSLGIRLSVLTINLWHESPPYEARAAGLRRWIARLAPDLVSFQEALREGDRCQVGELLQGLGYEVGFGPCVPFWKRHDVWYGNALASRLPIESFENHPLPSLGSEARRALASARIRTEAGPLRFLGTHLHHRGRAVRAAQTRVALERLEARPADEAVAVLAGDFNAAPAAPELSALRTRAIDVFAEVGHGRGITWSSSNPQARVQRPPGRRIDYVWLATRPGEGPACTPLTCEVVCHEPAAGVFPSDHFGVHATFELTRNRRHASSDGAPRRAADRWTG